MNVLPAYYRAGSGAAVVLLHCSLSSKNQWKALVKELEADHLVIALDLYGYGETPMPAAGRDFSLACEVALVAALLAEILPPDAPLHLVGHSYGGAVALRFCHDHPGRAATVTVFEPVAFQLLQPADPGLSEVLEMHAELCRLVERGRPVEAVRAFIDYWNGPGTFDGYPDRMQKDLVSRAPKLLLDFLALTRSEAPLAYCSLQLPVTLIAGQPIKLPALRVLETLRRVLPQTRLFRVDTGHMGPLTDPELVNPIIKEALSR